MRIAAYAVFLVGMMGSPVVLAQDLTGDPIRGRHLAREVCNACHAVDRGDYASPLLGPPPFQALAENPEINPITLRVLLQTPHRDMPDLILDADEMDDIIAYITSLR